ncbi:hypothetical protein LCGC14_0787460 [marine sediment metagenome]|uniref:Uncharacterized protein n=1 Tax=marine sediment metagenome TaxID=412755 RepID=A0A0F9PTT1_9ZZZZ|nr:hypothetical protein [bacterium]
MKKNKILSKIIFTVLIVATIGFTLAETPYFSGFLGSSHSSGCHGPTNPGSGTIDLISSKGATALPSEVFTISAEVKSFAEGVNKQVVIGFVLGSVALGNPARGDNDKFSFLPENSNHTKTQIDSSGNSAVINFQLKAPSTFKNYTLIVDVLDGAEGGGEYAIEWLTASINILVGFPSVPGAPILENVTKPGDIELSQSQTIQIDAIDNETTVDRVLLEFEGANHSLINSVGNTYIYQNWTPSTKGDKSFIIYAFDTENKLSGAGGFFTVHDTVDPGYSNYVKSADTVEAGETIDISIVATDYAGIKGVTITIDSIEHPMGFAGSDTWNYELRAPDDGGTLAYTITIEDNSGNTVTIDDSVEVTGGVTTGAGGASPMVFLLGSVAVVLVISLIGIALKKKKHFF